MVDTVSDSPFETDVKSSPEGSHGDRHYVRCDAITGESYTALPDATPHNLNRGGKNFQRNWR